VCHLVTLGLERIATIPMEELGISASSVENKNHFFWNVYRKMFHDNLNMIRGLRLLPR
jgi:hypothetical protein